MDDWIAGMIGISWFVILGILIAVVARFLK
jgi:hypothetical protein